RGSRHMAAASSLVRLEHCLCVVADDELYLGVFPGEGDGPGYAIQILDGEMPADDSERKTDKPDLEACVLLPGNESHPHGSILILGSGSGEARNAGALVPLTEPDRPSNEHLKVDLLPLFNALRQEIHGLNIEGAAVQGPSLFLLQRGDAAGSRDARIELDLAAVQRSLLNDRAIDPGAIVGIRTYDLGAIRGVPLTFSDMSPLEDGRIVFSASAEDSSGSSDGAIAGSALGVFDTTGDIAWIEPVELRTKIEGSTARLSSDGIEVLMVIDDDNPDSPTPLLATTLPTYP
ncbi:MAG: DUF6929 family protein, partial [Actinomycetota bacterium]